MEEFTITCFGIDLVGFEVTLGVEFLRTLGPILWDFEYLFMAFNRGGQRLLWKGLGSDKDDISEPSTKAISTTPSWPFVSI